ncbi:MULTISPECIES: NrfD/PsrC family molybdoenzyme membrane anchor subunit [Streptosporangium]|uniref:Formate-dependent nitrite reductase membrane component NrfD n=1 Tax=Streptosporangium brasiliense TaxID=47480 RepID=A0ABT9RLS7_9ACTN|nr:NrfD/PsrC family molybdoenzyme membrane anchor subunit [Streptosporangium brasiliense]MDP9870239.1 formate-dependent nitrite reductase membrane component NrfD [Streptosporangium brasiliense]
MTREREMVPEAEFRSYYGQPVIKPPVWHEPHMPTYLYLGGLSGASSVMGAAARLSGYGRLARTAGVTAALGATAGAVFLVAELGRPERFLNMLRVFKPTSPMSMGSWILAVHSGLTAVAAASEVAGARPVSRPAVARPAFRVTGARPASRPAARPVSRVAGYLPSAVAAVLPLAGGAASLIAGVATGPLMATYTAVLLADTAVPAWHEAHRELPFMFAGSALASAGAAGMLATPRAEAGPARAVAVLGAAVETAAGAVLERRLGLAGEPYHQGKAGRRMRAARVLTAGGGLLATVAGRSRALTALSGLALTAGSLLVRFGVLEAGRASAADPKYTVVPQRRRLAAGEPASLPPPARTWP